MDKLRRLRYLSKLRKLEWSHPTPEADNDGACPVCFAGKPMKFSIIDGIEETFDRKNHMVYCRLAAELESN
jgi:hypothetical protein